ncbi:hypothetical protein FHL15_005841 [Xylaria flabelliformis]|uniref:Uncharacterized protein n=1 Tax=Xylaria flabelliformis TaxID=2512241 RepID=A0A553HZ86_9PEZI|nr:hypothetical protein FHL15_005841 [Xylaria flabelliformis]
MCITDALLQLFDYPRQRPTLCDNEACYKVDFKFTKIAYRPINTFSARLSVILEEHRAAVQQQLKEQQSPKIDNVPAIKRRQRVMAALGRIIRWPMQMAVK